MRTRFEHPGESVPMARVNLNDMYYSRAGADDGQMHPVAEIVEMLGKDPYIYYDARTRLSRQIRAGGPPHLMVPTTTVKFASSDIAASLIFNIVISTFYKVHTPPLYELPANDEAIVSELGRLLK
jgi:hypothetical protein